MSLPPSGSPRPGPVPLARRRRLRRPSEPAATARAAGLAGPLAVTAPADPLAALYREHYAALVRLASLVVGDLGVAEQLTQDAFVKLHQRWGGLRRLDKAPAYLRSAVLNGARSHLRRQKVVERHDARRTVAATVPSPEAAALGRADHERVVDALRRLPVRQREALVLRYYLDLAEAEIAAAMGVSAGSVKTHLHRGLAALARHLGEEGA